MLPGCAWRPSRQGKGTRRTQRQVTDPHTLTDQGPLNSPPANPDPANRLGVPGGRQLVTARTAGPPGAGAGDRGMSRSPRRQRGCRTQAVSQKTISRCGRGRRPVPAVLRQEPRQRAVREQQLRLRSSRLSWREAGVSPRAAWTLPAHRSQPERRGLGSPGRGLGLAHTGAQVRSSWADGTPPF